MRVYMLLESGASGSKPEAPPGISNGPRARFFVPEGFLRNIA
jgi:hypothetical protein